MHDARFGKNVKLCRGVCLLIWFCSRSKAAFFMCFCMCVCARENGNILPFRQKNRKKDECRQQKKSAYIECYRNCFAVRRLWLAKCLIFIDFVYMLRISCGSLPHLKRFDNNSNIYALNRGTQQKQALCHHWGCRL